MRFVHNQPSLPAGPWGGKSLTGKVRRVQHSSTGFREENQENHRPVYSEDRLEQSQQSDW